MTRIHILVQDYSHFFILVRRKWNIDIVYVINKKRCDNLFRTYSLTLSHLFFQASLNLQGGSGHFQIRPNIAGLAELRYDEKKKKIEVRNTSITQESNSFIWVVLGCCFVVGHFIKAFCVFGDHWWFMIYEVEDLVIYIQFIKVSTTETYFIVMWWIQHCNVYKLKRNYTAINLKEFLN